MSEQPPTTKACLRRRRRHSISALLLACLVLILLIDLPSVMNNSLTASMDQQSMAYLDQTMTQAGAAFLLARALNASISVLQSFTVTPFVGELGLGQVLDPINDLVERFSWVMLAVTVSLGIQKLLLEIGVGIDMSPLLAAALGLLLISLWLSEHWSRRLRLLALQGLLLLLFIRFAMPLSSSAAAYVSEIYLLERREVATQEIESARIKISGIEFTDAISDPQEQLDRLKQSTGAAIEHIITLLTLFLFETLLLPLLLLWLLLKMLRSIAALSQPPPATVHA